jgi:integrase
MAVYPKGKGFMASVGTGPTRTRKTFATESEALAWEQSQQSHYEAVKGLAVDPLSLVWSLQKATDHCLRHRWAGKGGERKAMINAQFAIDFFGADTLLTAITGKWIVEYMEEMMEEHDNVAATLNKKMSALKVILTEALDIGGIAALPRMKRYTEATRSPHWFTPEDEKVMLEKALDLGYTELHDFIAFGIDTGFRRGEILGLRCSDLMGEDLLIHADATKGKTARAIPASDRCLAILKARQGHTKVFTLSDYDLRVQWTEMREALRRSDDPFFIPHTMRHTCATRLLSSRASLKEVQMWLGHRVIESTMVYSHLEPGQLSAAGARMQARASTL